MFGRSIGVVLVQFPESSEAILSKGRLWLSIYLNPNDLCQRNINDLANLVCTDSCIAD